MTAQTTDPAKAGTREAGRRHRDADRAGGPRYRFAAPIAVSREDIAERIADAVARAISDVGEPIVTSVIEFPNGDTETVVRYPSGATATYRVRPDSRFRAPATAADAAAALTAVVHAYGVAADSFATLRPPRPASRRRGVQVAAQQEGPTTMKGAPPTST